MSIATAELIESAPDCIRSPFLILVDQQEKAPFAFGGLRARSFIDKEMREYCPVRTERRFLGVGMGDYSLDGYQGRVAIERKSMVDFQGTLLGWRHEVEAGGPGGWTHDVDRRARFKRELRNLAAMECKVVIVESTFWTCLDLAPTWGVRTASENAKYLHSTYLSWQIEFPGVPWIFCDDKQFAAVTCFRILEKFWSRMAGERRKKKRKQLCFLETT